MYYYSLSFSLVYCIYECEVVESFCPRVPLQRQPSDSSKNTRKTV